MKLELLEIGFHNFSSAIDKVRKYRLQIKVLSSKKCKLTNKKKNILISVIV